MIFDLVYPMFALVVITFVVMLALFRARVRAMIAGDVKASYFKTYQGAEEPRRSRQLSRQFTNLFESPLLFYVACLAAMLNHDQSPALAILAWIYVAVRVAHAWIHIGRNKLRPRMYAYFASWLVLLSIWVIVLANQA